jgi:transcriptional regulator with XRE-family HTH domain
MIEYPHFALSKLYLANGYSRQSSQHGDITTYVDEDGLEECVRRILVHTPKRLNGRQLRFLRRGLSLSQEAFGTLVDRDAQTIARIEKANQEVPRYIDLAVRIRYLAKIEPSKSVGELLCIHDLSAKVPQEKIVLFRADSKWQFRYDIPHFTFEVVEAELTLADLPAVQLSGGKYVIRARKLSSTDADMLRHRTPSHLDSPSVNFSQTLEKQTYASSN